MGQPRSTKRLNPSLTDKMLLKKLLMLLIPLLAIFTGLSKQLFRTSSVQSLADFRHYQLLIEDAAYTSNFVTDTNRLVNSIRDTYFTFLVDSQLTSEELVLYTDATKAIESMHDSVEAVASSDNNFDFTACKPLYYFLDSCANWSNSTMPDPAAARRFLHKASSRLRLCSATLNDAVQQHALVSQLSRASINWDRKLLRNGYLPMPASSPSMPRLGNRTHSLKERFDEFQNRMRLISLQLLW